MADHDRLKVLKALTELLQGITPTNGFGDLDLSESVYRGRLVFGVETEPPFVSINESPRPDFGTFAGGGEARSEIWNVLVQGWMEDDTVNPTDPLYPMLSAMEQRLALVVKMQSPNDGRPDKPVDPYWYMLQGYLGAPVASFEISPPVVRSTDQATPKACLYIPLRIGIACSVG